MEKSFGPMELLRDLEKACNIVKQGETRKEKDNAVQALLSGTVDTEAAGAKELFHRRALFITMLRERRIWNYPGEKIEEPKDDPEDDTGYLSLV